MMFSGITGPSGPSPIFGLFRLRQREIVLAGGMLNYFMKQGEKS